MALHHGRKPPQSPPLFTGTSQSVIEDTKRLVSGAERREECVRDGCADCLGSLQISRSKNLQDAIVADHDASTVSFNNVLLPMAMDDNKMGTESHILCFYQSVSSDQGLRDASTEAEKLFDDFGIESSMREDVFNLVDAVFKKESEAATLDPESQRLLEKDRKGYIKSGLGLPVGTQRDRFKEIQKRLSELTIQFQKTLNEEKGGLWFAPVELDGVPADVLDSLKKGTDENEGKIRLTFKYPDLFPALKYAKSAEARKRIFLANENKCSSNIPLLRETLILRDEAARLLGYKDHAHYRIEDKMAKTPETVDRFLGDLRQRLGPGGDEEVKKLKDLKISDMASRGLKDEYDGHYYLWDHRFYDRLLLEKEHSLDQQLIAEYFPLSTTIVGMLKIFEELFGLSFVEITGSDMDAVSETGKGGDIIWHQDVQLFSVWNDDDAGGDFVGYIYFDLFPRENKYGHAANFNLQPGYIKEDGTRRYPATGKLTYPFSGL